jgi:hypothetical protein
VETSSQGAQQDTFTAHQQLPRVEREVMGMEEQNVELHFSRVRCEEAMQCAEEQSEAAASARLMTSLEHEVRMVARQARESFRRTWRDRSPATRAEQASD